MVYQEVALQNAASASHEGASSVITVSLDEKPGVQAIENTAADLPPVPGQHSTWSRDHEYKRQGTLSIPAAVALPQWRNLRASPPPAPQSGIHAVAQGVG